MKVLQKLSPDPDIELLNWWSARRGLWPLQKASGPCVNPRRAESSNPNRTGRLGSSEEAELAEALVTRILALLVTYCL
jgi:hypothetical protein